MPLIKLIVCQTGNYSGIEAVLTDYCDKEWVEISQEHLNLLRQNGQVKTQLNQALGIKYPLQAMIVEYREFKKPDFEKVINTTLEKHRATIEKQKRAEAKRKATREANKRKKKLAEIEKAKKILKENADLV